MKWILLLFIIQSVWAQAVLTPVESNVFRPGDIAHAMMKVEEADLQKHLEKNPFTGAGDKKYFIIMSQGPFAKGESPVQVVFGPDFAPDLPFKLQIGGRDVSLSFKGWQWNPQPPQVEPAFQYQDIPLFSPSWWKINAPYILMGLLIFSCVVFPLSRTIAKRQRAKKEKENLRSNWKTRLQHASGYLELSMVWKDRDQVMAVFPECQQEFRTFFDKLNHHQFKKNLSDADLPEILMERDRLLRKLEETHGV